MSAWRAIRGLAASVWLGAFAMSAGGAAVAFGALSFVFQNLNEAAGVQAFPYAPSNALVAMIAGVAGALIAGLRPRLSIGWLMLATAVLAGIAGFAGQYGPYAYASTSQTLQSVGAWTSWVASWTWIVSGTLEDLVFFVFPTGRLLSARWWIAVWAAVAAASLLIAAEVLPPGSLYWSETIPNPAGVAWAAPLVPLRPVFFVIHLALTTGVAAVALLLRFWRARRPERQQIKWFVLAVAIQAVLWAGASLVDIATAGRGLRTSPIIAVVAVTLIYGSIAISVLRYRLFDIDVIINRTLVYGLVTALLAGAFAGLSVVTQRLTLALTGQESELAVVLAALVVTALFQPLRVRVQRVVDRRFYRSKYDASHTLERFASRVRDEVELDRLSSSLVGVVQETMQPAHASLWLRPMANEHEAT